MLKFEYLNFLLQVLQYFFLILKYCTYHDFFKLFYYYIGNLFYIKYQIKEEFKKVFC